MEHVPSHWMPGAPPGIVRERMPRPYSISQYSVDFTQVTAAVQCVQHHHVTSPSSTSHLLKTPWIVLSRRSSSGAPPQHGGSGSSRSRRSRQTMTSLADLRGLPWFRPGAPAAPVHNLGTCLPLGDRSFLSTSPTYTFIIAIALSFEENNTRASSTAATQHCWRNTAFQLTSFVLFLKQSLPSTESQSFSEHTW